MSLCVINDGLTNNGAVKLKATPCQRLLAVAIISTALFTSQRMNARNTPYATQSPQATQQSATQSADQASNEKKEQQTFTGVIEKSGDQLVLIDPLTKTSYQLDDQRKAQELVNKNVRVTGVLDPSTGTIRVTAIAPI
jgi:hypothetical protein